jgi:hypothetical protein
MELRSKGTDLFAWSRFGEESNIGYIFFRAEKGADLFKLELKSILNKSVPFCSFCSFVLLFATARENSYPGRIRPVLVARARWEKITPSGSYDFVTLPDGTIKVSRPNVNEQFSTHLG